MQELNRGPSIDRRTLLKGIGVGALGLGAVPLLAACTGTTSGGGSSGGGKSLTFGSNASDPVPKKAYASFVSAFEKKSGDKVTVMVHPLNSGKAGGSLYKVKLADGTELGSATGQDSSNNAK